MSTISTIPTSASTYEESEVVDMASEVVDIALIVGDVHHQEPLLPSSDGGHGGHGGHPFGPLTNAGTNSEGTDEVWSGRTEL
jgi:hypothetical protein